MRRTNHDSDGDRAICEAKIMDIGMGPITIWQYKGNAPSKDFKPKCSIMSDFVFVDGEITERFWCEICDLRDECIYRRDKSHE